MTDIYHEKRDDWNFCYCGNCLTSITHVESKGFESGEFFDIHASVLGFIWWNSWLMDL